MTPVGLVEGHEACASALKAKVADHLLNPAQLDPLAQEILLKEVELSFTDEDHANLNALPNKVEIKKSAQFLQASCCTRNRRTDGIFLQHLLEHYG